MSSMRRSPDQTPTERYPRNTGAIKFAKSRKEALKNVLLIPIRETVISNGLPYSIQFSVAMTPAIELLVRARIAHEVQAYEHQTGRHGYGDDAVEQLGLDSHQVFKTLIASSSAGELLVAVIPVAAQLHLKALATAAAVRHCEMASPDAAQRATGYVLGGISPLGQKRMLRTFIDSSAQSRTQIHVSAGRRGLEVALSPHDLATLTGARFAVIARER